MNRREFLAAAAAAPMAASAQVEDGLTSLFDGQTLNGWSVQDGPASAFYAKDGAIVVHESANFPAWLRSARQYENFDFRGEFFVRGWTNSGIYMHAPEHGRPMWCGMMLNIFHTADAKPTVESMGSILPVVPPLKVNVKTAKEGAWNTFRILMDWPRLQVWTNGEMVQDLDVESVPELRYRLRRGYLGFESLSYPIRFRNLRVRELPTKEAWQVLYESPADFKNWFISDGKPLFEPRGEFIHGDNQGHLATREKFRDFALQMYIRHMRYHNSGILFRSSAEGSRGRHYEIQLHDVEGAHYPTGSLYHFKRSIYPRIEAEKWFLFQLIVKDKWCLVRINGENVMEYNQLDNLEPGSIELQAHDKARWTEFKQIRIRPL